VPKKQKLSGAKERAIGPYSFNVIAKQYESKTDPDLLQRNGECQFS
jgi:hypothetical protein